MQLFGADTHLTGPREAAALGIGMVHQHFKLVRPFSILENVLLSQPSVGGAGSSYARQARDVAQAIVAKAELLGARVDPHARVNSLSVAEQQRVEVIKALVGGARILILDEPTAVLTDQEADRLLHTLRDLANSGATIVLVTHKLADVKRFADTVTIMRGGKTVAELDPSEASIEELTRLTVGEALPASAARAASFRQAAPRKPQPHRAPFGWDAGGRRRVFPCAFRRGLWAGRRFRKRAERACRTFDGRS